MCSFETTGSERKKRPRNVSSRSCVLGSNVSDVDLGDPLRGCCLVEVRKFDSLVSAVDGIRLIFGMGTGFGEELSILF